MTHYWDRIIQSPGLSHLATDIFLRLDLTSLAWAELVSKSWRKHVVDKALWKKKLVILTKITSYNLEIANEDDKEKLSDRFRSLCWNRKRWMDLKHTVWVTRNQVAGNRVENFAVTSEGDVVYADPHTVRLASPADEGTEKRIIANNDSTLICFDAHGEHAIVGTHHGMLAVCDWRRGAWLPEAEVQTKLEVEAVEFSHEGDTIASVHWEGTIILWEFTDRQLTEKQRINAQAISPRVGIDLSSTHLMCHVDYRLYVYAVGGDSVGSHSSGIARGDLKSVAILRNVPRGPARHLGVSSNRHSLQLWDLDRGKALNEFKIFHKPRGDSPSGSEYSKVCLSECPETGILAVGHDLDKQRRGVTLLSTAGLVSGSLGHVVVVNLPVPSVDAGRFSSLVATPDKIYFLCASGWRWTDGPEFYIIENEADDGRPLCAKSFPMSLPKEKFNPC